MTAALQVHGLTKLYDGVSAVKGVSFTIPEGEIGALIGPNGAGKTTTIDVIAGRTTPTNGKVRLFGEDITGRPPHRVARSGLVRTFQLAQLFPNMSARSNVIVGTHLHTHGGFFSALFRPRNLADRQAERDADDVLELVGLRHRALDRAGNLPYGQQKLLEIARALATRPRMLLLDEPAAGLTPQDTKELGILIQRLRGRGLTILFVEHDMNLVMTIAEKIVVLDFGNKIAEGTPDEISTNTAVRMAYLG